VRSIELDPATDWLPIAPAAHYLSGGVLTDLDGATALGGLWAAGETACSGVHGANRLASNSLLEGMVFGARLSEAICCGKEGPEATGALRVGPGAEIPVVVAEDLPPPLWLSDASVAHAPSSPVVPLEGGSTDEAPGVVAADVQKLRDQLQRAMTDGAGVLRSEASLTRAAGEVAGISLALGSLRAGREVGELANLALVALALLHSAALRDETRGAHARRDHPEAKRSWRRRLVHGAVSEIAVL
jgi:L-aspartate oxidase